MKNIFFLIIFILSNICAAQSSYKKVSEKDFYKYEVDKSTYQYKRKLFPKDSLPNYINIPTDKGYLVSILKGDTIYHPSKTKEYEISLTYTEISVDKKHHKLKLKGKLSGAWSNVTPKEYTIFIGERKDSIIEHFLLSNPSYPFMYEGKIIDSISTGNRNNIFLQNAEEFKVYRKNKDENSENFSELLIDIETPIHTKSILIFSLSGIYSRIFEIGKLLD